MKWNNELIKDGIIEISKTFSPARMPTNREVIEISGNHALACAIQKHGGYEHWATVLGLEQKYSESRIGLEYERKVADLLRRACHTVEETTVKHPYDLLIDGCVKIDVKVANTSKVRGDDVYAYRIAKRQHTCDFYICCENDGNKDMYVIPANMVNGQVQIEMGRRSGKYTHYRDAFYLIDDAVNFYRSLVIPF